ncbi:MAG: hypothetical protein OIF54_16085, partial [Cohaesibacter sp.]|nr:hypothetical protein [Cohaesibacter sp.]
RKSSGYELRPGMLRNESIDLSNYALAVAEHKGLLRLVSASSLPDWAKEGWANSYAVALPANDENEPTPRPARVKRRAPTRMKFLE